MNPLPWHLYLMASLYLLAGFLHFIFPRTYRRIMPRYLPAHGFLVFLSGVAEVLLGLGLLFARTRAYALWGIILMLVVFFSVHIHMICNKKAAMGLPKWFLWLRLPMQLALIYWAYSYLE